jgi:hypothetical protein
MGLLGLSVSVVVGAAGCADSDGDRAATSDDYDDVAQALGGVVATDDHGGETGSFYDATLIAVGTPPLNLVVNAAGGFDGKHANLAYAYDTKCSDAAGNALPACGLTTDAAQVNVTWTGNLETPHVSASIDHRAELRLAEIQSGTVAVSGDGDFELDAHFESAWRNIERDFHLGYSVSYDGVLVQRLPMLIVGGTARYTIDAERKTSSDRKTTDAAFRIDGELAFAADGTAQLTLDGEHHYTVNMASGAVTKN